MKMKMCVTLTPDSEPIQVITNLLCICEWEKAENRKLSDGLGIGMTDIRSWAFFMLKQSGRLMPEATAAEWHKAHPNLEIDVVDETDPNPTVAAATAAN